MNIESPNNTNHTVGEPALELRWACIYKHASRTYQGWQHERAREELVTLRHLCVEEHEQQQK